MASGYNAAVLRRLFTFASVVSLLIYIATAVLWVRSYSHVERFGFARTYGGRAGGQSSHTLGVTNAAGVLRCDRIKMDESVRGEPHWSWVYEASPFWDDYPVIPIQATVGPVGWGEHSDMFGERYSLTIPHWVPFVIFGFLPAVWLSSISARRKRAQARLEKHCCVDCGYDLRATPGRCPECGHVTKGATA